MKLLITTHFERSYAKAPNAIQKAFDKAIFVLIAEPPSPITPRQEVRRKQGSMAGHGERRLAFLFHH